MIEPAQLILDELKKNEIRFMVTVPDNWLKELLRLVANDKDLVQVPVAREEEGVGICTGFYLAGKESVLIIQNSGFFLSCNALKSLTLKYRIPLLILISNRGSLEEDASHHIASGKGLVTVPLLKALQIPYLEVSCPEEAGRISEALNFAKSSRQPVAVILGKRALVSTEE